MKKQNLTFAFLEKPPLLIGERKMKETLSQDVSLQLEIKVLFYFFF